jgi:mono/diheme cytochrome c family protein
MRKLIIAVLVVGAAGAAFAAWLLLGPGPMDFAGGQSVALADYHADDPTGVPASLAKSDLIARGEYLAKAADCEACHTAPGGAPFTGGLAFVLPFGTLYSVNITPDKATGIGNDSGDDFLKAMHKGIRHDGAPLYPAMPYASYTAITDADALAIKAFLFSLKPVHAPAPQNRLAFPFNQRWAMRFWGLFFNSDKRFMPNAERSPEWNRGAYLVEAMAHCGECHTPRNLAQALDNRRKFAGAVQAGWTAYNISSDKTGGIGGWSDAGLAQYLFVGHADGFGTAAGPMGEAVDKSLSRLAPQDIAAMVTYLRTVPAVSSGLPAVRNASAPQSHSQGVTVAFDPRGKQIFEGACASCHEWSGSGALTRDAALTGSRAVNDPAAKNVAQIVLNGTKRPALGDTVFMPAFRGSLSDAEIAAVANYVTARFGAAPSGLTPKDVATMRQGL